MMILKYVFGRNHLSMRKPAGKYAAQSPASNYISIENPPSSNLTFELREMSDGSEKLSPLFKFEHLRQLPPL